MFSQENVYDRFCNGRDARDGAATEGCDSPQTREKDEKSASNFTSIVKSCCFMTKMSKREECCQHKRYLCGMRVGVVEWRWCLKCRRVAVGVEVRVAVCMMG